MPPARFAPSGRSSVGAKPGPTFAHDALVVLPNESNFFMGMPVGLHFALNLLIEDVFAARGPLVDAHMEIVSRIQDELGQFL